MKAVKYSFDFVRGCFAGQRRTYTLDDLGSFAKVGQVLKFAVILNDLRDTLRLDERNVESYTLEEMSSVLDHRFFTDPEIVNAVLRVALVGDHGGPYGEGVDWTQDVGFEQSGDILGVMFEFVHVASSKVQAGTERLRRVSKSLGDKRESQTKKRSK